MHPHPQETQGGRFKLRQPLSALAVEGALLKIDTVCAVVGMSPSSLRRAVAAHTFPEPLRIGTRCTRWRSDDVRRWLASQGAAACCPERAQ